jgi:hypothetical protein
MRSTNAALLTLSLLLLATGCSGSESSASGGGGSARVSLDGVSYEVRDVSIVVEPGEDGYFRIEGEPVANPNRDCISGLSSGLNLYGDLPSSVHRPADLVGKRLKVDFTGDGDETNFCFVGMEGLAGAEDAWVTIESVNGNQVTFSMSGTFKIFDEEGEGPVKEAKASGTAIVLRET